MKILPLETVGKLVADFYNVKVQGMQCPSRLASYVLPRKVFTYLARKYTRYSYQAIGAYLKRDHTSIIYFYGFIENALETDVELAAQVIWLAKELEKLEKVFLQTHAEAKSWVDRELVRLGLCDMVA